MYYFDNNLCCLCLTYKKNYTKKNNYNSNMHQEYKYFLSEFMLQEPQITKQICKTCMKQLENVHKFREKCLKNISIFNNYVWNLKQGNGSYKYLSVNISKTSHSENNKSSHDTNVKEEIFENDNYNEIRESPTKEKYGQPENIEQVFIISENTLNDFRMATEIFVKDGLSYFYENNLPESLKVEDDQGFLYFYENNMPGLLLDQTNINLEGTTKIEQESYPETVNNFFMDSDTESPTIDNEEYKYVLNENDSKSTKTSLDKSKPQEIQRLRIKKKVFKCDVCQKSFAQSSNLKKHALIHSGIKPFPCKFCSKSFNQSGNLKRHKLQHTGDISYACDVCHVSFTDLDEFRKHRLIFNTADRPYACNICKKIISCIQELGRHKLKHIAKKLNECNVCQKKFNEPKQLQKHKLTHERQLECDVCQKTFSCLKYLNKHKLTHNDKSYSCDVCQKKFATIFSLKQHSNVHSGERPYECDVCHKRFKQNNHLVKHERIHTGEKPYVCLVCNKAFSQPNHLKTHVELIHNRG